MATRVTGTRGSSGGDLQVINFNIESVTGSSTSAVHEIKVEWDVGTIDEIGISSLSTAGTIRFYELEAATDASLAAEIDYAKATDAIASVGGNYVIDSSVKKLYFTVEETSTTATGTPTAIRLAITRKGE